MPFRRKKISIIGAGQVGATCALMAASRDMGDVVLLDRDAGTAKGKALDILQAGAVQLFDGTVRGTIDRLKPSGLQRLAREQRHDLFDRIAAQLVEIDAHRFRPLWRRGSDRSSISPAPSRAPISCARRKAIRRPHRF